MRIVACTLLLIAACQSAPRHDRRAPAEKPFAAPPLADVVKLFFASSGARMDLPALIDELARNEVVFFGETHLDETTHRLELAVYSGLIRKTGGRVVLAMEMFERDVQPALDDYLAGHIDEPQFLHQARAWGNYRTGYRALIETAKRRGLPVVASNAPAALRRTVGFYGRKALDELPPDKRALLPDVLLPNTAAYWKRFARVVRGHMGMIAGTTRKKRITSGQSLWDNTMGDSCARALKEYPGHVVLHVNGAFHSQYREGAVTQLLARRPDTRVAVLEAVAVDDLPAVGAFKLPGRADYVAAVDARARGTSEGFHAVTIARELRYRVRMPKAASREQPAPLLIWLSDQRFSARDGLDFWRTALGDETAFVVVEPPFPAVTDDLYRAGRWFWPQTFREDLGTLASGLARIAAYVLRHYPVDSGRVILAGEGTGATVVAATHLYGGLDFAKLAIEPRRHGGLRRMALPAPEKAGTPLTVFSRDAAWWKKEAKDHKSVGRETRVVEAPASGWELFGAAEQFIRTTLRMAPRPAPKGSSKVLALQVDTPRARRWAYRMARRLIGSGQAADVVSKGSQGLPLACLGEGKKHTFGPAMMKDGKNLPLASGPFGGTTVLYVPRGRSGEQRAAWQKLEDEDVLHKRSRFAHVMVVFEGDAKDNLRAALSAIRKKKRSTVLVVPAVFCATAADMRRWADEATEYKDVLNISWLPGLGATVRLP